MLHYPSEYAATPPDRHTVTADERIEYLILVTVVCFLTERGGIGS